jgi:hypothetical protein
MRQTTQETLPDFTRAPVRFLQIHAFKIPKNFAIGNATVFDP